MASLSPAYSNRSNVRRDCLLRLLGPYQIKPFGQSFCRVCCGDQVVSLRQPSLTNLAGHGESKLMKDDDDEKRKELKDSKFKQSTSRKLSVSQEITKEVSDTEELNVFTCTDKLEVAAGVGQVCAFSDQPKATVAMETLRNGKSDIRKKTKPKQRSTVIGKAPTPATKKLPVLHGKKKAKQKSRYIPVVTKKQQVLKVPTYSKVVTMKQSFQCTFTSKVQNKQKMSKPRKVTKIKCTSVKDKKKSKVSGKEKKASVIWSGDQIKISVKKKMTSSEESDNELLGKDNRANARRERCHQAKRQRHRVKRKRCRKNYRINRVAVRMFQKNRRIYLNYSELYWNEYKCDDSTEWKPSPSKNKVIIRNIGYWLTGRWLRQQN